MRVLFYAYAFGERLVLASTYDSSIRMGKTTRGVRPGLSGTVIEEGAELTLWLPFLFC